MTTLRTAFLEFDGIHTAPLVASKDLARADLDALIALCGDTEVAVAATWVAKALVEDGVAVDLKQVFATLAQQSDWAAQLHVLQCVRHAPEAAVPQTDHIRALLGGQKALVRVWALDAFVRLADLIPDLRDEAAGLVEQALTSGTASLRARARDLKVICAVW